MIRTQQIQELPPVSCSPLILIMTSLFHPTEKESNSAELKREPMQQQGLPLDMKTSAPIRS